MNYPVSTSAQLSAVLRGLRQTRSLSQAQVGQLLGVNQKRVARIENVPGVTSFDQIARLVSALGGRIVIEAASPPATADVKKGKTRKAPVKATASKSEGSW